MRHFKPPKTVALSLSKGVSRLCATLKDGLRQAQPGGLFLAIILTACVQKSERVDPADHRAFWLWAGVKPQPVLDRAKTIYILEGEIRKKDGNRIMALRAATPRIDHADVWLVYRVETLDWGPDIMARIIADLSRWRRAGSRAVGIQIDFDAATRGLEGYAAFLRTLRSALPPDTKLGITGLMDWSSRADPGGLKAIAPVVDEIIIQTYQGRATIPGYAGYVRQLDRLDVPFKLGLVQGGEWRAPVGLIGNDDFRGYVVFLVNPV